MKFQLSVLEGQTPARFKHDGEGTLAYLMWTYSTCNGTCVHTCSGRPRVGGDRMQGFALETRRPAHSSSITQRPTALS